MSDPAQPDAHPCPCGAPPGAVCKSPDCVMLRPQPSADYTRRLEKALALLRQARTPEQISAALHVLTPEELAAAGIV